jgi:3-isopropylmalate/(R)-2-methylmalate dehydratase small subunit
VPQAMKAAGIQCVVGKSFARIFERNCVNLGLMIMTAPQAAGAAKPGDMVRIDARASTVQVGDATFDARPLPTFMLEMIELGGLVPWARRRVAS